MRESRKRLKYADSYIRITVLCFSVFVILIIAVLQPSEVTHNQIQDDETQTDRFYISNHDPKYTSLRLSETDPPVVTNGQIDVIVNEGIAQRLRWDIDDAFSDKYVIYRNGTEVANGTYGNPFTVYDTSINLVRGVYNFTIFANDTSTNFVTDTAYVTVLDVTGPIVADTGDFNTTEVSSGNEIPWIGTDIHPSHYIIYRNNTEVKTGLWNSSIETIMYNIDDLSVGVYNFSIEMYDDSNNKGTDHVIIHVTDVSSPVVLSSTDPLRFSEFDIGRNLVLNVTDSHPDKYIIFQDGFQVINGSWSNYSLIIYNLDNLAIGNYSFNILMFDEFFNNIQIDIDVEIYKVIFVDSKKPQFTITTQVHDHLTSLFPFDAIENYPFDMILM